MKRTSFLKKGKVWVAALVTAWVSLIALTLNGPTATAQPRSYEPQAPFTFVEAAQPERPDIGFPPVGETVIVSETFQAGFNTTTSMSGTTPLWRVTVDPTDSAGYYWGRVSTGTYLNTAWSAVSPFQGGPVLNPGVSAYPAGQKSWLLYGPLNLSKYAYARLTFEYRIDAAATDKLYFGATYDGSTVYGSTAQDLGLDQWLTGTLQLDASAFATQQVYLAFGFESQAQLAGLGVFLRNVTLSGQSRSVNYLPVVSYNNPPTPVATLTPTPIPPLIGYTFDAGTTTDLAKWGGRYDGVGSGSGGAFGYGQCLTGSCLHPTYPHGNPLNSLRLYNTAFWYMVASSPNDVTPADYELQVDVSPVVLYPRDKSCGQSCPPDNLGNWYGIIFNASNNTFGATPNQFYYNGQYYRFFFYNIDAALPIGMALDRCNGGSCTRLGTSGVPVGLLHGIGNWDSVRVRRVGSLIEVYVNDTLIFNRTDSTFMSGGKFGVFTFPSDGNATQYPPTGYEQQVDFDNIRVYNP